MFICFVLFLNHIDKDENKLYLIIYLTKISHIIVSLHKINKCLLSNIFVVFTDADYMFILYINSINDIIILNFKSNLNNVFNKLKNDILFSSYYIYINIATFLF